jgi:hypothetical protein
MLATRLRQMLEGPFLLAPEPGYPWDWTPTESWLARRGKPTTDAGEARLSESPPARRRQWTVDREGE